jgi:hypothetical protein
MYSHSQGWHQDGADLRSCGVSGLFRRPMDDDPIVSSFIISDEFISIAPLLCSDGRHDLIGYALG